MASGDHARKQQLQVEEEQPHEKGKETPGMEGEPTPSIDLEDKMNVINLDEKNLTGESKLEGDTQALDSGDGLTPNKVDDSPVQPLEELAPGAPALEENKDKVPPEAEQEGKAPYDLEMFRNIREKMIKECAAEWGLERIEYVMSRFGKVYQVKPGMESKIYEAELQAIGLESLVSDERRDRFMVASTEAFQLQLFLDFGKEVRVDPDQQEWGLLEAARKGYPELGKRVNDLSREMAAIKEGIREIWRRFEVLDKAAGDALKHDRQAFRKMRLEQDQKVMKAEEIFERVKPELLKHVPKSQAEETGGTEGLAQKAADDGFSAQKPGPQVAPETEPTRQEPNDQEMYEKVRQFMLKKGGPWSLERVEAIMTRFGRVYKVEPGMDTEKYEEEFDAIRLEVLKDRLRVERFFQPIYHTYQLKLYLMYGVEVNVHVPDDGIYPSPQEWSANFPELAETARKGLPEIVRRVDDHDKEFAAIQKDAREICRRSEALYRAAGDALKRDRQEFREELLQLEEMVLRAEKEWFETVKPSLLEDLPKSQAEEEGGAQDLDSGEALAQKANEGSPAQEPGGEAAAQEMAYEEEFESIRNLLIDFGEPISFEGLKALMARLKVGQAVQVQSGMETGKLLEELDGIQLEYIRSIVRLNHFINGAKDVGMITQFPTEEDQDSLDQPKTGAHPKVTFPDLREAARKGRPELVRRVAELYTELAEIKAGTTRIRRRIEKVDQVVGDVLLQKRRSVREHLLKHEKCVAEAETYFERVQSEVLKLETNPEAEKEALSGQVKKTKAQVIAEVHVLFQGRLMSAGQLHELKAAICDCS